MPLEVNEVNFLEWEETFFEMIDFYEKMMRIFWNGEGFGDDEEFGGEVFFSVEGTFLTYDNIHLKMQKYLRRSFVSFQLH